MEPCAPGITLDHLGCPVPSECVPCTVFTFTSMSTVSIGNCHLKCLWSKLHSGHDMHAIWKISFIVTFRILEFFAMLFCPGV